MRILSVVTLVSPDGAYGGPLRVAVNQAVELTRRGHEVTLVAAHQGFGPDALPDELEGVPLRLFRARRLVPGTGFAGLCAPAMLPWVRSRARDVDVVHVHLARDLVTLPVALLLRRLGVPYVVQSHGMLDASDRLLAKVLDPVATVPALRGARAVFVLTPTERADLARVVTGLPDVVELANGVPPTTLAADPAKREVLYLARLAARKRPALVVEVADALVEEFPDVSFRLVGPDEGEAGAVLAAAAESRADVVWEGPLDPASTLERMSRSGTYLLPAVDEPYPMSVLEAMSVGLPVVVTDSCGLAPTVGRTGAGVVTGPSAAAIATGLRSLLGDPARALAAGAAGRRATAEQLGMSGVGDALERTYLTAARAGGAAAAGRDPGS